MFSRSSNIILFTIEIFSELNYWFKIWKWQMRINQSETVFYDFNVLYGRPLGRTWNPGSSVGSKAECQFRGCEFETQLGQNSFRRWQKSMWQTGIVLKWWTNNICGQSASWLEILLCGVVVWESLYSTGRWPDRRDMTDKLFEIINI